jgi:hypothetical protein
MKHLILSTKKIDQSNSLVEVELIPGNKSEINAIKNMEEMSFTYEEKELVENYLHFNLGLHNYSILESINQNGNIFILKIYMEK